MLKKTRKLLMLGIMVCAGSAYVTPTYASSAILLPGDTHGVIMTHIYPATESGATHELIALLNTTDEPIDVSQWCARNKNNHSLFCFSNEAGDTYVISPHQSVVIVSEDYAATTATSDDVVYDHIFSVANKSSGSLVGSNDTVQLYDEMGRLVDGWSWTATVPKGNGYIRHLPHLGEGEVLAGIPSFTPAPIVQVSGGGLVKEASPIIEEEVPSDDRELKSASVYISEIYPNPVGADGGNEFVELVNQGDVAVLLDAFALRITSGTTRKIHSFPSGVSIAPGQYLAFSDTDMKYTLNNSAGQVELIDRSVLATGEVMDDVSYQAPKEAASWALFLLEQDAGVAWEYTLEPTPGGINVRMSPDSATAQASDDEPKPCADMYYRNPETGRCKKVVVASLPSPCKEGQYRSPDTGRCRNIAAVASPTPCKQGQERNPETNRCRNSVKMTTVGDGTGVSTVKEVRGSIAWYAWATVAAVVAGVFSYAAWEWRVELQGVYKKLFRKGADS